MAMVLRLASSRIVFRGTPAITSLEQKGYKSLMHGTVPEVRHFASFKDEVAGIEQYVKTLQAGGHSLDGLCVVARTEDLVGQYEGALREKGFDTYRIRRSEPEDRCASGIRLATMHRVKGLEFDRVIIAGVKEGVVPLQAQSEETTDPAVLRELENHDRALLYVSATRAKITVLVTSYGRPSRFLQPRQRSES